jgi:hypothetical protein
MTALTLDPAPIDLRELAEDVRSRMWFAIRRRKQCITITGNATALADYSAALACLTEIVWQASCAAMDGAHVRIEIADVAGRCAVDVVAAGWDPQMPQIPPVTSPGCFASILRTASGARVIVTMPRAA